MAGQARKLDRSLFFATRALAGVAVIIGCLVLGGWWVDVRDGRMILPTWPPMVANTGLMSVLAGVSLFVLAPARPSRRARAVASVFSGLVCVIAGLTLVQYVLAVDFGIDQMLVRTSEAPVPGGSPGRPAPQSAIGFLTVGAALLTFDLRTRRGPQLAESLAIVAGAIPVVAVLGYLVHVDALYGIPALLPTSGMAVETAAVLTALSVGMLAARPHSGLMSIVTADDMGGIIARWLFSSLLILPPVAIALVLGTRTGRYSTASALAMLLCFALFEGVAVILVASSHLSRLDAKVARAHEAAARTYEREALQRSWLQALFDSMPECVVIADERGTIIQQNDAARLLVSESGGVGPGGIRIPHDVRRPSGEPLLPEELPTIRAMTRGETIVGEELAIMGPDGILVPILASATPVKTERGLGAIAVFRDIRSLKELERLREEWAAVIAHDLRQPVSAISLSATMLAKNDNDALREKDRKAISRIREGAARLDRMIDDLLDASRLEARRLSLERHEENVCAVVDRVVESSSALTSGYEVEVAADAATSAWIDAGRIEQVLVNLLSNAAKYGKPGTIIRLETNSNDEWVEVVVTNEGPGISRDQMAVLFSRFARTREARAGGESGLGLGLYISKGLVEAHGGRMWAESVPGETTSFHFTLPRSPEPPDSGREENRARREDRPRPRA